MSPAKGHGASGWGLGRQPACFYAQNGAPASRNGQPRAEAPGLREDAGRTAASHAPAAGVFGAPRAALIDQALNTNINHMRLVTFHLRSWVPIHTTLMLIKWRTM